MNKDDLPENKLNIINELEQLLFNNKNNIQDLIDLLVKYFESNTINFNFIIVNDINDLIHILFNIIYSPQSNYIKNDYDLITMIINLIYHLKKII